jgi:hypothetical protein
MEIHFHSWASNNLGKFCFESHTFQNYFNLMEIHFHPFGFKQSKAKFADNLTFFQNVPKVVVSNLEDF